MPDLALEQPIHQIGVAFCKASHSAVGFDVQEINFFIAIRAYRIRDRA